MKPVVVQVDYKVGPEAARALGMKEGDNISLFTELKVREELLALCFVPGSEHVVALKFDDPVMEGHGCSTLFSFRVDHSASIWHNSIQEGFRIHATADFEYNSTVDERVNFVKAVFTCNTMFALSALVTSTEQVWCLGHALKK